MGATVTVSGLTPVEIRVSPPPWESRASRGIVDLLKQRGFKWSAAKRAWLGSPLDLAYFLAEAERVEDAELDVAEAVSEVVAAIREKGYSDAVVAFDGDGLFLFSRPPWAYGAVRSEELRGALRSNLRWQSGLRAWMGDAHAMRAAIAALEGLGFEVLVLPQAKGALEEAERRAKLSSAASIEDEDLHARLEQVLPEGLRLFPYQEAGVAFLEAASGRALIGDEMGLGKTVQALAYFSLHREKLPALVVAPAVMLGTWRREIGRWLPWASVRVLNGRRRKVDGADFVVVSYDTAWRRREVLEGFGFRSVVADECHYVKNPKSKRAKWFMEFARALPEDGAAIFLSGTPVTNRPAEFFTALNLLAPDKFPSYWKYIWRYCGAYQGRFGLEFDGPTNVEELGEKLRALMVRRLKRDVLAELPEKIRQIVPFQLGLLERRAYLNAVREAEPGLPRVTAARRALAIPKAERAIELAKTILEEGRPVVVFAHHREAVWGIYSMLKHFASAEVIDGSVSPKKRSEIVEAFQNGSLDAVVLSTKAAGVGITLTRASDVIVAERQWSPADEEQAEDRVHRIGQERGVVIRYLLAEGTIDEHMAELLERKRREIHEVLDESRGVDVEFTPDIRRELVEILEKEVQQ